MHVVRTGRIVFEWPDGERTDVSGGGAVIIPPGTATATRCLRATELISMHFSVDQNPLWEAFTPNSCFGMKDADGLRFCQPAPEKVWGLSLPREMPRAWSRRAAKEIPGIVADCQAPTLSRRASAHHRFAGLLVYLVELAASEETRGRSLLSEERVARAEMAFVQNLHSCFGVEDMARAAGYERSHFSVVYRRVRGEPPRTFVKRVRTEEAARLLRETDLAVRGVAAHVGYPNQAAFARFFRRMTGRSPGSFRCAIHGRRRR
jgi:AraC-like DNA-binding protein